MLRFQTSTESQSRCLEIEHAWALASLRQAIEVGVLGVSTASCRCGNTVLGKNEGAGLDWDCSISHGLAQGLTFDESQQHFRLVDYNSEHVSLWDKLENRCQLPPR
jgi:hypothetical protein